MADFTFPLQHPVEIAGEKREHITLRTLQPEDIIEASIESERLVAGDDGNKELIVSPTLMGIHSLRRQVKAIGDLQGPMDLDDLNKLNREDFELLQLHAEQLDDALMKAVIDRGKAEASAVAGQSDDSVQHHDADAP